MEKKKIETELKKINEQLQILGKNISFLVQTLLQGDGEIGDEGEGKLQLNIEDAVKQSNEKFRSYLG